MKEDLPWRAVWYDMDGNQDTITYSFLNFGKKICNRCHTNIKPIFTCKRCHYNSCDACSKWARNQNRMLLVHCPECKSRIGVLV